MPRMVAYHPEILVVRGTELYSLRVDLNDWYRDDEVLRKMASLTGGATVGEVVEAVEKEEWVEADDSILSARISKVDSEHVVLAAAEGKTVLQWDDRISACR